MTGTAAWVHRKTPVRFDADHEVPVLALHAHDELVAGDAGVVDQDLQAAELGGDVLYGLLDAFFVGDVHLEAGGLATGGGNFFDHGGQLVFHDVGHGDRGAGLGQRQGNGAADALRRAGDERNPTFYSRHSCPPKFAGNT